MNGNNVTGSTNPSPGINRAAYAYTALTEIDRKIKEVLREYKIDNSSTAKNSKVFIRYNGWRHGIITFKP